MPNAYYAQGSRPYCSVPISQTLQKASALLSGWSAAFPGITFNSTKFSKCSNALGIPLRSQSQA